MTPKKILLLAYDSFAEFEIAVLLTALRGARHELTVVAPTGAPVRSAGGLTVQPDHAVTAVDPDAFDALILPGGDPAPLLTHPDVLTLIKHMHSRGVLLAAICDGPALLGAAGVLDGTRYTASLTAADEAYAEVAGRGIRVADLLVQDGNLVTASGSNYLAFAERVLGYLAGMDADMPLPYFRRPSLD